MKLGEYERKHCDSLCSFKVYLVIMGDGSNWPRIVSSCRLYLSDIESLYSVNRE
jgi:hypothetical protein